MLAACAILRDVYLLLLLLPIVVLVAVRVYTDNQKHQRSHRKTGLHNLVCHHRCGTLILELFPSNQVKLINIRALPLEVRGFHGSALAQPVCCCSETRAFLLNYVKARFGQYAEYLN